MAINKVSMQWYRRVGAVTLLVVLVFQLSTSNQRFRLFSTPLSTSSKAAAASALIIIGSNNNTSTTILEDTLLQCRELLLAHQADWNQSASSTTASSSSSSSSSNYLRPIVPQTTSAESTNDTTSITTPSSTVVTNASTAVPTSSNSNSNSNSSNNNYFEPFCSSRILGEKQKWNHHKKVISYAIFGPNNPAANINSNETMTIPDWVIHGMEKNMIDAKLYFPDWIVRVHVYDLPPFLHDKWLIHNASLFHNVELVRCFSDTLMAKSNSRKMLSRFLAHDDPKVRYTLVRDADSRLSLREVMAVNEFIEASMATDNLMDLSNPSEMADPLIVVEQQQPPPPPPIYFHAMRDHSQHIVPIMGGMFGMKRGLFEAALPNSNLTMSRLLNQALQEHPNHLGGCCGEDQLFLQVYMWPHVQKVALSHDMQLDRCRGFRARECREFPLGPRDESINYFIGSGFKQQDEQRQWQTMHKQHTCTLQCTLTNETM